MSIQKFLPIFIGSMLLCGCEFGTVMSDSEMETMRLETSIMETEDIYPISSTITRGSIGDFWLHIDHELEKNRDIVYLVYNPQNNKG